MNGERPTVFGDGQTTRDFTFVSDVVAANLAAAAAPADGEQRERLQHRAGQDARHCSSCWRSSGELLGVEPDPVFADPRPGDIHRSCADASAATRDLGWKPSVSIDEGLSRYVDWLRESRPT